MSLMLVCSTILMNERLHLEMEKQSIIIPSTEMSENIQFETILLQHKAFTSKLNGARNSWLLLNPYFVKC